MILKLKTKPALIVAIVILTVILTWIVGYVTDREIRNAFMLQTQIGANTIDVKRVESLTGTVADLKSPDYLRLKQQLSGIRKVDKNLYFVYLMENKFRDDIQLVAVRLDETPTSYAEWKTEIND